MGKNCKSSLEYTIHGIANAESYAIDLFWDLIARFYRFHIQVHHKSLAFVNHETIEARLLPEPFFDDMVHIATQEADHFLAWKQRLFDGYQIPFGSLPCQEGLWKSAVDTCGEHILRYPTSLSRSSTVNVSRRRFTSAINSDQFDS